MFLARYFLWYFARWYQSKTAIVFIQPLRKQPIRKQQARQTAFVALFAVGLLLAQLATVFHDADHAFHHHTHLCDSFTTYDHNKNLPIAAGIINFAVEKLVVFYAFTVSSPLNAKSSVTRIRGPPSLLV